jgi:endoglycosylceramidase
MRRRRFVSGVGGGLTAGLVGFGSGSVQGQPTPGQGPGRGPGAGPLRVQQTRNGPFFVDEHGRVVVLHGVNVGQKTPPFVRSAAEFDVSDIERIRSWGFNLVRLGVIWEGIAPERGTVDASYLDRVETLVRQFADHGVHVLLDMHQDLYSREFAGDGAPAWAVYTDGIPFRKSSPWQLDYGDPAVARAFDHFWLDDHELQTAFTDAFRAVARRVADVDALAGYELFNEPSPGERTAAGFSERVLPSFYERVAAGLREVDPTTPMWVEPEGLTNSGKPATLGPVDVEQLAYSFHNYADLPFDAAEPRSDHGDAVGYRNQEWVFANNRRRAEQLGAVPVLTEFSPGNDTEDMDHLADLADDYLTGWAYWAYDNWGTRTSGEAGTMVDHPQVVDTLVRPYPPAVAGLPESWGFDRDSREFSLTYTPSTGANRPTVLFVPARQYPDGYTVEVSGGSVTGPTGAYVRIRHHPRATRVQVSVKPA